MRASGDLTFHVSFPGNQRHQSECDPLSLSLHRASPSEYNPSGIETHTRRWLCGCRFSQKGNYLMAKKTKSRREPGLSNAQPRSYSELYGTRAAGAAAPAATPARGKTQTEEVAPQRNSDTVDWKNEYSHIFGDLRQLLVISALLFGLMIVLGFVM